MNEPHATDRHCSLEEIATKLGLTRERVRQIEFAALRKCRRWAMSNGYEVEDLIGEAMNRQPSLNDGSVH